MERLRPLNDFIFKKLFGEPESKDNLRAFLNALLYNNIGNIKEIEIIKDKELTTDEIINKTGIIDVLAKIEDGTHINIEVQLTDQKNMDKRTLFYWSRIYNRGIIKGEDYSSLNKVITINILDFNFIDLDKFHTEFTLRESEHTAYKLTDVLEIHFIEMPKFKKLSNKDLENDRLQRWLMFLRNDISDSELEVLINMDNDIKKAEERLEYLSSDPQTMEIYWERERALHEKANLISTGKIEGKSEEKIDTILRSYKLGFTTEQIALIVELKEEQVIEIISKNNLDYRN
ncbi:Rpn family recombination-promoting nuclease/putative transposase [Clostridium sp.]|uniref:Rpn family recombination-promoting nuclease/putative transposase n=1 Tax=Clostridium sp. TaxID=1506 RepID=UPI003F2BFEA9